MVSQVSNSGRHKSCTPAPRQRRTHVCPRDRAISGDRDRDRGSQEHPVCTPPSLWPNVPGSERWDWLWGRPTGWRPWRLSCRPPPPVPESRSASWRSLRTEAVEFPSAACLGHPCRHWACGTTGPAAREDRDVRTPSFQGGTKGPPGGSHKRNYISVPTGRTGPSDFLFREKEPRTYERPRTAPERPGSPRQDLGTPPEGHLLLAPSHWEGTSPPFPGKLGCDVLSCWMFLRMETEHLPRQSTCPRHPQCPRQPGVWA